jgi:hypothetical protein
MQQVDVLKVERLVTVMKASAIVLTNELVRLRPAVHALTDGLLNSVEDLRAMPPDAAMKLLRSFAKVHRDVSAVACDAVELERLVAGEATSIVKHVDSGPVDLVAVRAELEAAERALRRAETTNARQLAEGNDDGNGSNSVH